MSSRQFVSPYFAPGSGWHQTGHCSPGSAVDRAEMKSAAVQCTVIVLRNKGVRIPAARLLATEPPSGWLVCLDRYTAPQWYACLFTDEGMAKEKMRLMHARLERENAGVRLYGGIEPDRNDQHRQAWLCAPTPARAREILLGMLEKEGGSV